MINNFVQPEGELLDEIMSSADGGLMKTDGVREKCFIKYLTFYIKTMIQP